VGERAPATAAKTVQGYVSQLRKVLGDGVILTQGRGYLLAAQPEQVDVRRFELLAGDGRSWPEMRLAPASNWARH